MSRDLLSSFAMSCRFARLTLRKLRRSPPPQTAPSTKVVPRRGRRVAEVSAAKAALAKVADYIHLNPVRAKIVPAERLAEFRWSSLRRFLRGPRTPLMCCGDWLRPHGFEDTARGLQAYADHLRALARDEAAQKRLGLEQLSKGWAIGTAGWCRAIAKEHADRALDPGMESGELRGLKETRWNQVLTEGLDAHRQSLEEAASVRANVPWKIAIAQQLRKAGAPYSWITQQLVMGAPSTVRVYLNRKK